jgi:GntP family permease
MTPALTNLAADPELAEPVAAGWQLVLAALAGIAVIVVLITIAKLHPFLALIFGALTVGIVAGVNIGDVLASFVDGFGTTAAGVGVLIALGAMFAKLLADSGGALNSVTAALKSPTRCPPTAAPPPGRSNGCSTRPTGWHRATPSALLPPSSTASTRPRPRCGWCSDRRRWPPPSRRSRAASPTSRPRKTSPHPPITRPANSRHQTARSRQP